MKKAPAKKALQENEIEGSLPKASAMEKSASPEAKKEVAEKKQTTRKAPTKKTTEKVPPKASATKPSSKSATKAKEPKVEKTPKEKVVKKKTAEIKSKEPISVVLQLRFHTEPGQTVWVTSSGLLLGDSVLKPLYYEDNDHWRLNLTIHPDQIKEDIQYRYHIKNADGSFMNDYQDKTIPVKNLQFPFLFIRDFWSYAGYHDNVYYKAPFDFLFKGTNLVSKKDVTAMTTHLFQVKVPYLQSNEGVCLLGDGSELGNWGSHDFQKLHYDAKQHVWKGLFFIKRDQTPIAYKYGIYDKDTNEIVRLENGGNRYSFTLSGKCLVVQNDGFINLVEKLWKGAGVNIPLFSIRTDNDLGIGDFGSIRTIVDWMSSVGLKLLQLLPINDTTVTKTWEDSYPYSAISVYAIHPIYLDVLSLLTSEQKENATIKALLEKGEELNQLAQVDYESVFAIKWQLIELLYSSLKKTTVASSDYKSFIKENAYWLKAYAAFSVLRDQYSSANYELWGGAEIYSDALFDKLQKSNKEQIQLYFFIQYILSLQLKQAVQYAHDHHIVLKGDIPIGVDRYSVDVWQNPTLFNVHMQAGAPPDFFTKDGQNWGFPTYRWDVMAKDDYAWWKARLTNMAQYFDAIRIDHILGFFRIWSIPETQVNGILGYFQPCLPIEESEFAQWNIPFDYNRYCKPFINETIINEMFGDNGHYVKTTFLDGDENGLYRFKSEFDTQRKIKSEFDRYEQNAHNAWLLKSLLDLITNVIFIPDAKPGKYHCRFVLHETSSYANLSDWEKKQLYYLYLNYFFERQENNWRKIGYKQLSAITNSTDMLICGEDLGMVPKVVPVVMSQLGILGLKVQRMSSDASKEFTNPLDVEFLNIVTPTTHDMLPVRNWWNQSPEAIKDNFFHTQLGLQGFAPEKCDGTIVSQIVFNHLQSPALWSLFLIQDLLAMEDATTNPNPEKDIVNRPEIPHFYWRYRMHISVEDLTKAEQLNGKIKNLLQLSNR